MIPKDKPLSQYRSKDSHIFIRNGWLVIDEHPDGRFCKLAKAVTINRKLGDSRSPVVVVGEVHLKKFGPPSVTTLTKGDLIRMLELVNMTEGVLSDGTPVGEDI